MEYRENKRLNARVSLLGFGGMRFPTDGEGKIREAEAAGMLRRALEGGVNYFDTAHYYHDSQSEGFLGRALAGVPRDSYYLATKLPVWKVESVSDAQEIFDLQLERLRTGCFDFYLFHALDRKRWQAVKEQGLVEWAEELQRQGKIRRLGFSFHDSYEAFEEILTARQWDFCQLQLNYLDTEEQAGLKGYHLAERMGVPVVVMEPVKGGLLAAPPEEVEELLRAARPERTPAGWALRWAASLPGVLTVLSGMGIMAQVEENLATFARFTPLEPEETELLARAAAELRRRTNNGCTGCEYCMPCPAGVDIPENFSLWNRLARCRDASLLWRSWNEVLKDEAKGKHCVGCGRCEEACPQHLPIRADLARAQAALDAVPRP